jgi:ABC-2 type transport system ATP-binding protein
MNYALEIEHVHKAFGRKVVLKDVSFTVPTGSVFALLGENGAGKSTLIRSLLGYHRANSGTIRVLGMDPRRQAMEIRRAVGYVSDAPAFYEWMTVQEVGAFAAGFYPPGFLETFLKTASEFQLTWETRIRDLSKGMRSKVALALATSFQPSLLILDEPTSGLDPVVRRQFLESMVDRAAAGQTVFLSSHQIHEVERVADWIAILHQGVLQVVEPLESLKTSISQLHFSMHDPLLPLPSVFDESQIIHCQQDGRAWQLMIRDLNPAMQQTLLESEQIFDVRMTRPSLEEIYIAFTTGELSRSSPPMARALLPALGQT